MSLRRVAPFVPRTAKTSCRSLRGCVGGTETFGRFVEDPFSEILQDHLGISCVNFGQPNAGLDVFLGENTVIDACAGAELTVIQITGASNLSNRFYTVHRRRNDRFLNVTPKMRTIFPTVDFTEFHYTRHMLSALEAESPTRFRLVRDEIQDNWIRKMNLLTHRIGTRVVLLWTGDRTPDDAGDWIADGEPLFITRQMLNSLRGRIADVVELPPQRLAEPMGKIYPPEQERAARLAPGPEIHETMAEQLADSIQRRRLL